METAESSIEDAVRQYGAEVLSSAGMRLEKQFFQHGNVTVYAHSFAVACLALYLARRLHLRVDQRALVRGALLHDYFLYDWHIKDPSHRLHGFSHAQRALENAVRDFPGLSAVERDVIQRHMFPLNLTPPKYRESALVCAADKLCALCETFSLQQRLAHWTYLPRKAA